MNRSVCVLISVFMCCCESSLKRNVLHAFSIQELTVTSEDLKDCGKQKNVCVMSSTDCLLTASDGTPEALRTAENFVNTSCHYLIHEESLTCRWIQLNDEQNRAETTSTFIFSRAEDFIDCPSILNVRSSFYLIIKSKNVFSQREMFSDVYPVILEEIVQAPRPVITSVNSTDTSLNVTWASGKEKMTQCQIRYKHLSTESWTETAVFQASLGTLYIIDGLQPFTEYSLTVSCFLGFGVWSDWSHEARVMTSESCPSAAPQLSYYLVWDRNSGTRQLGILWKALEMADARGLIREYEVSYVPIKRPFLKQTVRTSDLKIVVPVLPEKYDITVAARNAAGRSPIGQLRARAALPQELPAVKDLWASSDGSSLQLHWEHDVTAVNVSEFAIEWRSSSSSSLWKRVNSSTFTSTLTGIEAAETYNVSVYPVYHSLCGPPVSVPADLQHGTLLDLERFRLVSVTKSSVVVKWRWKRTTPSVNVLQYRLVLKGQRETQNLTVFPHQVSHSFTDLQPNAKYTVCIHAQTLTGNFSKASLDVNTLLLDSDQMMKYFVPLVLLVLGFGIFSVLTRTLYKEHFFPNIANPGYSLIGHWLLNTPFEGNSRICVLRLENEFIEHQTEKNIIQVERRMSLVTEDEDVIPSKICTSSEGTTWTTWRSNSDYVENTPSPSSLPEYIDLPILPVNLDYVDNQHTHGSALL